MQDPKRINISAKITRNTAPKPKPMTTEDALAQQQPGQTPIVKNGKM